MYESFFGLKNRPFVATPTLERYYPAEGIEQSFQTVARVVERGEGPVAIIGGAGVGKSMLCLRVAESWPHNFEVIMLSSSKLCSRRALLQSLLFELRMPYRDLTEGELRLSLMDRLQWSDENPSNGLILVVDEAQSLNLKLLEELRLLTNLAHAGQPRVRLVLAGNMRLEELLAHPSMESLSQRLAARCYLKGLNANEVGRYLRHKIELCGVRIGEVFTEEAIRHVYRATDGIPRLVDQVADHAMRLAANLKVQPIGVNIVEQAWAELQQLPGPCLDKNDSVPLESFIEFGSLEEEDLEFEVSPELVPSNGTNTSTEVYARDAIVQEIEIAEGTVAEFDFDEPAIQDWGYTDTVSLPTSIQSFDLDDDITIHCFDPCLNGIAEQSVWLNTTLDVPAVETPQVRAENPFGQGFVEEFEVDVLESEQVKYFSSLENSLMNARLDFGKHVEEFIIPIVDFEEEPVISEDSLENELRELISSLNLVSEVSDASPVEQETDCSNFETPAYSLAPSEVIARAFPGSQNFSFSQIKSPNDNGSLLGDDRDLIVIEDDVATTMDSHQDVDPPSSYVGVPQNYIQLFSKLRG